MSSCLPPQPLPLPGEERSGTQARRPAMRCVPSTRPRVFMAHSMLKPHSPSWEMVLKPCWCPRPLVVLGRSKLGMSAGLPGRSECTSLLSVAHDHCHPTSQAPQCSKARTQFLSPLGWGLQCEKDILHHLRENTPLFKDAFTQAGPHPLGQLPIPPRG